MPAVVPFIPLIAAAVGTGGALYAQNRAGKQQRELLQQQQGVGKETMAQGRQFLGQAQQAFGPALGYYSSILADPRSATAPEQNRIGTLYQGQAQTARNQFQRGGYGPSQAEAVRGQQRAANEEVIQRGRPMAAGALANIGGGLGQLGMQGFGLGSGIMGNVFNQGLMARQQSFNEGSAMGQGLFNAYNQYLMGRATQAPASSNTGGNSGFITGSISGSSGWPD